MTPLPDATPRAGGCWSLTADGLSFRDLNGNGELDPYEDPRRPIEERVDDLLARMTLEEKAAQLFHQGLDRAGRRRARSTGPTRSPGRRRAVSSQTPA